jgi:hypothetical protein
MTRKCYGSYQQASTERGEKGWVEETSAEEAVAGRRIIYYQARGAGARGMNNMTTLNKIVIEQQQQDCPERNYTDFKSAINERGIPNEP